MVYGLLSLPFLKEHCMTKAEKYFRYLIPVTLFGTNRTKEILNVNPVTNLSRKDSEKVFITVYDFDETSVEERTLTQIEECMVYRENKSVTWINIDGIRKHDVEFVSEKFGIHPLIAEDILSRVKDQKWMK